MIDKSRNEFNSANFKKWKIKCVTACSMKWSEADVVGYNLMLMRDWLQKCTTKIALVLLTVALNIIYL